MLINVSALTLLPPSKMMVLFGHDLDSALYSTLEAGYHIDSSSDLLENIDLVFDLDETGCKPQDYFAIASRLQNGLLPNSPLPHQTFTSHCRSTAYLLVHDLSLS